MIQIRSLQDNVLFCSVSAPKKGRRPQFSRAVVFNLFCAIGPPQEICLKIVPYL